MGPVLDGYLGGAAKLPWPEDDSTPMVVVSFSTGVEQASVAAFQRTLDALADEPVHVVATTAGTINSEDLSIPSNSDVQTIHDAAMEILRTPSYQDNARSRALALKDINGVQHGADELEGLLQTSSQQS